MRIFPSKLKYSQKGHQRPPELNLNHMPNRITSSHPNSLKPKPSDNFAVILGEPMPQTIRTDPIFSLRSARDRRQGMVEIWIGLDRRLASDTDLSSRARGCDIDDVLNGEVTVPERHLPLCQNRNQGRPYRVVLAHRLDTLAAVPPV